MTEISLQFAGRRYRVDLSQPRDISITLDFHGAQPRHFGAGPARAEPMQAGGFTGDTRLGGSCNAEQLTLIPHCNGTHTECLGHVTERRIAVTDILGQTLMPAALVSVMPRPADCGESADPSPRAGDQLVTRAALAAALSNVPDGPWEAVVVRTLPNTPEKKSRAYKAEPPPAYFSLEAMDLLRARGVTHLLTDLPSVDRFDDDGQLAGHRRFWGMSPGDTEPGRGARPEATITEMVFVADDIDDGLWLLDLQVAPFASDASPSRPLLYAMEAG